MKSHLKLITLLVGASLVSTAGAIESKISGSMYHSLFIDAGNVFAMGKNAEGEVDTSTISRVLTPKFTGFVNAKSVSASAFRTAVLSNAGVVQFTGRRVWNEYSTSKAKWSLPETRAVSDMAAGQKQFFYVVNGVLYRWDYSATSTPQAISTAAHGVVKSVAAGVEHAVVLFTDGTVATVGANAKGQLGNGTVVPSSVLVKINVQNIKEIAAGGHRSFLTTSQGTVLAFGDNDSGALGMGGVDVTPRLVPTLVPNVYNVKKVVPSTSNMGTLILLNNGNVLGGGWHNYIVGPVYTRSYNFVYLYNIATTVDIGGGGQTYLLTQGTSGVLRGWSGNSYGQLGNGFNAETNTLTSAVYTVLPSSVVGTAPPVDPRCNAVTNGSPFSQIDVNLAYACNIPIYVSMNACIKANPTVQHVGQFCKNLILPEDRGNGDDKKKDK